MNTQRITIEELQQRWEMLFFEFGIDRLKVTESFSKSERTFVVTRLSMELEDDFCICGDDGNILIDNFTILGMFLINSLNSIILYPIGNVLCREYLEFDDGIITIEKVA
jgi:hypothetical protein